MRCQYCKTKMTRKEASLEDIPDRVKYTCPNCKHILFVIEPKS